MFCINHLRTGITASLLLGALLLTGCEIDLSEKEEGGEQPVAVQLTLNGAAHGYQAVAEAGATVLVGDTQGSIIETTTDAQGSFIVDVTQLQSPLLVAVKGTQGTWYSYVANASENTLVMVNPLTSSLLTHEVLLRYGVLGDATEAEGEPVASMALTVAMSTTALTAEEKFQRLIDEGIFEPTTDDGLELDQNLTRADFTNIVVSILGLEQAPSSSGSFADLTFGFPSNYQFFQAALEAGMIDAPLDSLFTPSSEISREQLKTLMVGALGGTSLELGFDESGNSIPSWAADFVESAVQQLQLQPLTGSYLSEALRSEILAAASSFTNSLNSFKLANPSTWSYSISGSLSGDYSDVLDDSGCITVDSSQDASLNFTEDAVTGCLIVGAGATLPVNEGELAQWVKDVVRKKLEYYGGNFQFNTLELDATGTGVVGSKLEGSASGRVSVKLGPKEESANFTIGSLVLTRIEPGVM